VRKYTI